MKTSRLAVSVMVALACASGAAAGLLDINLAPKASSVAMFTDGIPTVGSLDGLRNSDMYVLSGSMASWFGPNGVDELYMDPYFLWSDAQDIRVLRMWGVGNYSTIERLYVDVLTGDDPTDPASWTTKFDSDRDGFTKTGNIIDIDLGKVYTTEGIRVRTELGHVGDSRHFALGQVQIFGDLNGDPGLGSLADFRLAEKSVAGQFWTASSTVGGTNGNYAQYGKSDRWLSLTQANQIAAGGSDTTFWIQCEFDGPESVNLMDINWVNKNDAAGACTVPTFWNVLYATDDAPDTWLLAGTFTPETTAFGNVAAMYFCGLGDLEDVMKLRLEVPFSALPEGGVIGLDMIAAYYLPPAIPEPATMTLLTLGGLAMLRRRGR